MVATLQKFRIIKEPGKPVGPHVDFARDPEGNVLRGKPYRDETGRDMPGDPIERQYYPGDVVLSESDLTQEMNGKGSGLCKTKFERVADTDVGIGEMEEFRAWKAAKAAGSPAGATAAPLQPEGQKASEEVLKAIKVNSQQRISPESLNAKSYKELIDLAKAEGVDLKGASKKEDLVKVLLAALNV